MKVNHYKSRIKINKKHQKYAKLMTQDDVNKAFKEYNAKQKKLAEIATRKNKKKEKRIEERSKGKRAIKKATAPSMNAMVLGSGSAAQVSNLES